MNTISLTLDRDFFGLIAFRILSFAIKLPSSWSVMMACWGKRLVFDLMWDVLTIIGSFQ